MFKHTKLCSGLTLAFGALAIAPGAVMAQEAALQRIEITGSRIKTIQLEGTSPVVVLGDKDLKTDGGVRNVEGLLNNLPQVFAAQGATVANGSTGTATVNLRGLGANRTLVLVNGRRLAAGSPTSQAADINQIPAALIKRVEILTGGASAVYGSDAVAGVVNFILNDRFEGVQIDLNQSFNQHKQQNTGGIGSLVTARGATNPKEFRVPGDIGADGRSVDGNILMGGNFADNKGNATVFLGFKKDDALLQSERDFSACTVSSGAAGFACGGSGTNATGRITNLKNNTVWTNADTAGTARRFNNALDQYNFAPTNYFQRPSERYSANVSAKYDVSEQAKIYSEFSFHDDLTVAQIAPGGAFGSIHTVKFDNPLLSSSWKTALGLVNPGDTTDIVLQRRNVEGGGRQSEFRNTSFRTLAGVKGDIGKWSYDAFAMATKVTYNQSENNYFLTPRIAKAMDVNNVGGVATCASGDTGCVPYNPWLLGGVTGAQLSYLQTPGFRKGSTELNVLGASVSSDLGEYGIKMPGAKNGVGVAFGIERRYNAVTLTTDAATTAGELSGSGGPTAGVAGNQAVRDMYAEVRVPLLEGAPVAELLSVNATYRNSNYEGGTNTNTWGTGAEWAPAKSVRVRGSYQVAIRAPNLLELYTPAGNNLYDNDADPCAGATPTASLIACQRTGVTAAQYGNIQDSPAGQYNYLQGGNSKLTPETAKSTTFGLVLTPTKDLSVTIDYFDIKVSDTISNIDPVTTLNKCISTGNPTFCNLIRRDRLGTLWLLPEASIVGTNQNLGGTSTSGFDLGFNYAQRLTGYGSLGLSFVGTLLRTLETEEIKGDGIYDCVGYYGASKCGSPNPKWRHKARLAWTTPWNVDLAMTWRHIGSVALQQLSSNPLLAGASNPVDRELKAVNYLDIAGTWNATKKLTLSGGINNVTDLDPPVTSLGNVGQLNGNAFPGVYDTFGRKIFMSASYKF